jgi:hypothetical protein
MIEVTGVGFVMSLSEGFMQILTFEWLLHPCAPQARRTVQAWFSLAKANAQNRPAESPIAMSNLYHYSSINAIRFPI